VKSHASLALVSLCAAIFLLMLYLLCSEVKFQKESTIVTVTVTHVRFNDFWFEYVGTTHRYFGKNKYRRFSNDKGFKDRIEKGQTIQIRMLNADGNVRFRYPVHYNQFIAFVLLAVAFFFLTAYTLYLYLQK